MSEPSSPKTIVMTRREWYAEGRKRFGEDHMNWKFKCPACGYVQSVQDYKDAGAPSGAVAFSCVGRWIPGSREAFAEAGPGPCNYAGGGLFGLNPVTIAGEDDSRGLFEFADAEIGQPAPEVDGKVFDYEVYPDSDAAGGQTQ